jgi:alpha-beta hydrolase superfamily lysophospholipase
MAARKPKRTGLDGLPGGGTSERIVYQETADDLVLRGLLVTPTAADAETPLVIWFHTRQQNFAEPEYVEIGRRTAAAGVPFLTVDTRGHDLGAWYRTGDGPILYGSAWERFSDCVLDIDAWVDAALALGYRRCILVGHGFSGAKVVHYQAQRQRPEVAAVFLASSGSAVRDKFSDDARDLAREMVAEGRGRDLMPWGTGGEGYNSTVSAEWFVARTKMHREIYGDATVPPAIARIRCPVVAWYGRKETRENRDVRTFLAWLRDNAVSAQSFDGQIIDDVGFYYRGREGVVVATMLRAMADLGLRRPGAVKATG